MKFVIKIFLSILLPILTNAQKYPYYNQPGQNQFDSLQKMLKKASNDTIRMAVYRELSNYYTEVKADSAYYYSEQQLLLARKLELKLWEADALDKAGYSLRYLGNYSLALQKYLDGIKIAENPESEMDIWQISKFTTQKKIRIARLTVLGMLHFDIAGLYGLRGYNKQHEFHFSEAKKIAIENNDQVMLSFVYLDLAFSGSNLNNPDSSLSFLKMALKSSELADYGKYRSAILEGIGRIYLQKREYELAKKYFSLSAQLSLLQNNLNQIAQAYESLVTYLLVPEKRIRVWTMQKKALKYLKRQALLLVC